MVPNGPLTDDGLVQLLTPAGHRTAHPDYDPRVAHLDADALRALYRDMVLVRRFDNEATSLQRQGELALYAQCLGQEAAQIGSGRALLPQDQVFPSYREHGVAHTRGVDLAEVLRLFRGIDHGGWDPTAHGFHLYTLVIGSHTLHATGYAMGLQRDGAVGTGDPARDSAVVTYFGDGSTSQGDVNEALVFAAVNNAPVVFFCQNNQWAISEPTSRQSRVPLADRGPGFGIPSVRVDGNDVLATYAVTAEALERARSGGGPTFIEAFTYRMGAHTTSDDPSQLPLGRRGGVLAPARPDRPAPAAPRGPRRAAAGLPRRARRRGRRARRAHPDRGARHGPPVGRVDVRARLRDAARGRRVRARLVRGLRGLVPRSRPAGEGSHR